MEKMKIVVTLMVLAVLYGCATGSAIVTGTTRPAINSSEVRIYIDPPSHYYTIGIVEASSDVELSSQAAQDRTINELKAQAAKLGANGVILLHSGEKSSDMVGFYSGGVFYAGTEETKTARGCLVPRYYIAISRLTLPISIFNFLMHIQIKGASRYLSVISKQVSVRRILTPLCSINLTGNDIQD